MTILVVIIGIALLILIHEFGHFLVAKKMDLLVEEFGIGFPPRLWSKKIGETTYSVNLLPFGGFVKIYGEDPSSAIPSPKATEAHGKATEGAAHQSRGFAYQPAWKRILIVTAGVVMNFFLGWFLISIIFAIGTPKAVLISEVMPDSPAALAGVLPQDQVLGFQSASEFVSYINENRGKEISITVRRDNEEIALKATPRLVGEAALGVALGEIGIERHSLLDSFVEGFKTSVTIIVSILAAFANLIWGFLTQGQVLIDFVGPIGIFGVASQAGSLGFLYLVQLIAMISLNLAVLNVLPFPALDGGRLLFILIEKFKGSPLSATFERNANAAGFLFLLLLMIAITIRDVARLF